MKILVTGGLGFVGSNLIKRLINEGHDVSCIDNLSTGLVENRVSGCTYHYYDCNDINKKLTDNYEVIFHLAALARIQASFMYPTNTFISNTSGTQEVLEYARLHNSKVIYAGSSSKWHDPKISPYAMSKYLGEELCKMYRQCFDLKVQLTRFYNVYGPGEIVDGDYAAVIGIWRRQCRDNQPITVVGDGLQRRDFTYINDIVDGLIKVMSTDIYHEDAWELGTGTNHSILDIAKVFAEKFHNEIVHLPDQHGNYRETLREHSDALTLLNWNPKDQLKEYINSL
jgi:UDP-glucose 4-epimerase